MDLAERDQWAWYDGNICRVQYYNKKFINSDLLNSKVHSYLGKSPMLDGIIRGWVEHNHDILKQYYTESKTSTFINW